MPELWVCKRLVIICGLLFSGASLLGCGEDTAVQPTLPQPIFPVDTFEDWAELRNCRTSHEHELRYIRVVVDAAAELPYGALSSEFPYPVGSTLVKLEYDDDKCTELLGYTAMQKLTPGTLPEAGDWMWQKLDAEFGVLEEGNLRPCVNCHTVHCPAPLLGYDLTCAEEL